MQGSNQREQRGHRIVRDLPRHWGDSLHDWSKVNNNPVQFCELSTFGDTDVCVSVQLLYDLFDYKWASEKLSSTETNNAHSLVFNFMSRTTEDQARRSQSKRKYVLPSASWSFKVICVYLSLWLFLLRRAPGRNFWTSEFLTHGVDRCRGIWKHPGKRNNKIKILREEKREKKKDTDACRVHKTLWGEFVLQRRAQCALVKD